MDRHCIGAWVWGMSAVLLGACAGAPDGGRGDEPTTGEVTEGLSAPTATYVTLRRNLRKCMAPMCGGYFVKDVNRTIAERYVSGLDFTRIALSPDDEALVLSSADGELVLRGVPGAVDPRFHTRALLVLEAYKSLPGIAPAPGDTFYAVSPRVPRISCFTAPCPNELAHTLNRAETRVFDDVRVDRASKPFVDQSWLADRVRAHGAIVAGDFVPGAHFAGGYETLLSASQVYLRLPEHVGPCPPVDVGPCAELEVRSYRRDLRRCVVPGACVERNACPLFIPACDDGYTLTRWTGPAGCNAFACDPEFAR